METKGNYYYLYNNVLFVTLNTGAYPGGNDNENAGNVNVPSASKDNSEAEAIVSNFRTTLNAATAEYSGQYQWLVVTIINLRRQWQSMLPIRILRTM